MLRQTQAADNRTATQHHPAATVAPSILHGARSVTATQLAAEDQLAQLGIQWLNQFDQVGQAALTLTERHPGSLPCGWRLALLLPCYQGEQNLLFTQFGASRTNGITSLTLGGGQRWLTTAPGHWGYNVFCDYSCKDNHRRLGIGLERRITTFGLALNGYYPISGERLADNKANKVRPASGGDLRLQYTPHNQPHWRFNLIGERYFGNRVAALDEPLNKHPTSATFGIDYTPLPLLTIGYGFKFSSGTPRHNHQLQLGLNYFLGIPLEQQLDPHRVVASHSLVNHLALVQRNANIVLTQHPNDVIQLRISPDHPEVAPNMQLNFKITSTPSGSLSNVRSDWEGSYVEFAGNLEINSEKNSATSTTPKALGDYDLTLVARNDHGVVARSNVIIVHVKAQEASQQLSASSRQNGVLASVAGDSDQRVRDDESMLHIELDKYKKMFRYNHIVMFPLEKQKKCEQALYAACSKIADKFHTQPNSGGDVDISFTTEIITNLLGTALKEGYTESPPEMRDYIDRFTTHITQRLKGTHTSWYNRIEGGGRKMEEIPPDQLLKEIKYFAHFRLKIGSGFTTSEVPCSKSEDTSPSSNQRGGT